MLKIFKSYFFIISLALLSACSVARTAVKDNAVYTYYHLTVDLLPGDNEHQLFEIFNTVSVINLRTDFLETVNSSQIQRYQVDIATENPSAFRFFRKRLSSSGLRVENLTEYHIN